MRAWQPKWQGAHKCRHDSMKMTPTTETRNARRGIRVGKTVGCPSPMDKQLVSWLENSQQNPPHGGNTIFGQTCPESPPTLGWKCAPPTSCYPSACPPKRHPKKIIMLNQRVQGRTTNPPASQQLPSASGIHRTPNP